MASAKSRRHFIREDSKEDGRWQEDEKMKSWPSTGGRVNAMARSKGGSSSPDAAMKPIIQTDLHCKTDGLLKPSYPDPS